MMMMTEKGSFSSKIYRSKMTIQQELQKLIVWRVHLMCIRTSPRVSDSACREWAHCCKPLSSAGVQRICNSSVGTREKFSLYWFTAHTRFL